MHGSCSLCPPLLWLLFLQSVPLWLLFLQSVPLWLLGLLAQTRPIALLLV